MHLSALNLHPVKSLRGFGVGSAEIDDLGFAGDRRFLVVDSAGAFLTQRTVARMAQVATAIDATTLTLRSEGFGEIHVGRQPDPQSPLVSVQVWKSEGLKAEDCGPQPADWLSRVLGLPCRLVRIGPAFSRPVRPGTARPGDRVHFADAFPLLVIGEASRREMNDRIIEAGGEPVPMDRFRTNLVVEGCEPFAEDTWKRIRIGNVVLRSAGPCLRCVITTTDQQTGIRGKEPLRTLATFRRDPAEPTYVRFGQNLINESKSGVLRVGDPVEVMD